MKNIMSILTITTLSIAESQLVTGTQRLFQDASSALLIISPIAAGVALGIMALIKMGADENDAPRWKKRMVGVVIALVIVFSASGIISLVSHYYTPVSASQSLSA